MKVSNLRKGLSLIVDGSWETLKRNTGKGLSAYCVTSGGSLRDCSLLSYNSFAAQCGRGLAVRGNLSQGEHSPRLTSWRFLLVAFVRITLGIVAPKFLDGRAVRGVVRLAVFLVYGTANPHGFALPFSRGKAKKNNNSQGIYAMSEKHSSWCRTVLSEITFFALCICCFEVCSLAANYAIESVLFLASFVGGAV